nr:AIR synthase related protein domain containing protein [Haemonchus contortus]
MPWEDASDKFPYAFSHPRNVIIEASNGASDYGNKFGEPVVCGFARSFGQRLSNGERCEYVKPIMFSGGIGAIDENQTKKERCHGGMLLAKIGGPVYRVGVGGGAASSQSVQGSRESTLDFCAVQRGDAEMGQKLHRTVRACAESGTSNPILSIHDQGAGGNGNVLKELVEGGGAVISADSFELGDETISARELWTAEYQENDACLVDANGIEKMMAISRREKCTVSVVGTVTDVKRVVLTNFKGEEEGRHPVDFDTKVLGEREKKVFHLNSKPIPLRQLELPAGLTVRQALEMVLRLPSVASKRYLTCKVDRSVTGLVARQQCVGPLHTPLADVAVVALSYFDKDCSGVLNALMFTQLLSVASR